MMKKLFCALVLSLMALSNASAGAIDGLSNFAQVEAVYIGYFGRGGDPGGVSYWAGAMNSGYTLNQVGASFFVQQETINKYQFAADYNAGHTSFTGQEIIDFITAIYQDSFNRAPDQAGLNYWENYLLTSIGSSGASVVGAFIIDVLNGAVDTSGGPLDATTLQNKITVATDFTTRTSAANLGTSVPLTANYLTAATTCVADTTSASGSIATGEAVTTNYINNGPH